MDMKLIISLLLKINRLLARTCIKLIKRNKSEKIIVQHTYNFQ